VLLLLLQVYGENMAILSGDALLTYAFEHICRDTKGVPAERLVRVVVELARASGADGLVGGQVVDIQSEDKEVRLAGTMMVTDVLLLLQAYHMRISMLLPPLQSFNPLRLAVCISSPWGLVL
jgi:geranylgeranyl pyrophosphate synthase